MVSEDCAQLSVWTSFISISADVAVMYKVMDTMNITAERQSDGFSAYSGIIGLSISWSFIVLCKVLYYWYRNTQWWVLIKTSGSESRGQEEAASTHVFRPMWPLQWVVRPRRGSKHACIQANVTTTVSYLHRWSV